MKITALIVAGGSGERFGKQNKLLTQVNGKPVIAYTAAAFEGLVDETVLVVNPELGDEFEKACPGIIIAGGGKTRTESVRNGLKSVTGGLVLIHDGARPFVSKNLITRCIRDTLDFGSSVAAVKTVDSIAEEHDGHIAGMLPRDVLYNVQTPQGFFTEDIAEAYTHAEGEYPDDSSVFAALGGEPHITEGEYGNRKITVPEDMIYFTGRAAPPQSQRIGGSFDTHRLSEGRKLMLGGIEIPAEKGLSGHSDADVLLHTLMGAILNALGLKDIGYYFPDTDPAYKDAKSSDLLAAVLILMDKAGYSLGNVSLTVIAEQPKLAPHTDGIKQSLSRLLGIPVSDIGLGATTAEGIGDIGKGDSIACTGYVLLKKNL